jgi:hypothetical protein
MPRELFNAYFDASGNKRTPVLTVAGFVSTARKWARFDAEWSAVLSRERVDSMHMTDFASNQKQFAAWRGQTDRRRNFIADLTECVRKNTNKGFASSVVLSDYNQVNGEFLLSERVGQPFTLCARSCLGGLKRWADRKKISLRNILVAIEHGDEDQGELLGFARVEGIQVISLTKGEAIALQAGDLAAWKCRTVLNNTLAASVGSVEDSERILRSLDPIRRVVQNNGGYDETALLKLCKSTKVPKRAPAGTP